MRIVLTSAIFCSRIYIKELYPRSTQHLLQVMSSSMLLRKQETSTETVGYSDYTRDAIYVKWNPFKKHTLYEKALWVPSFSLFFAWLNWGWTDSDRWLQDCRKKNLVQINSDVTAPVLYFPFLKGELMDEAGMTGNGQWKSSCSLFKANTKSSTRAALVRSLHNQPMSSKPNCAAKQPRSFSLISSNRRRAWRQSIMSMYMFSAQSLSLLHLQTDQRTLSDIKTDKTRVAKAVGHNHSTSRYQSSSGTFYILTKAVSTIPCSLYSLKDSTASKGKWNKGRRYNSSSAHRVLKY